MLVLDFDGVIADAFDECALVAWRGVRPNERGTAASLPDAAFISTALFFFSALRFASASSASL